jgi:hypothetical protein
MLSICSRPLIVSEAEIDEAVSRLKALAS